VGSKYLDTSPRGRGQRDYSAIRVLLTLCVVEVTILYVLIAVDTPLAPAVRRLLGTASGVVVLVSGVIGLLVLGMILFLVLRRPPSPPVDPTGV
jgi:hypothetical protein